MTVGIVRPLLLCLPLVMAGCVNRVWTFGDDGSDTGGDGGDDGGDGGDDGGGDDGGDGGDCVDYCGDDGGVDGDGPALGGSMGEEQGELVSGFATLVNALDHADLDYRIGVTTTDNGNPVCTGGQWTSPEAGQLQLSSCRERLDDFLFYGTDPATDKRQDGCLDFCYLESIDILPTSTEVDPTPRRRPWIEMIDGVSNIGGDYTILQALACVLPQGIAGCGFESHLESMHKALRRAEDSTENNYGFMRDDAHLLLIFVTDEIDCSYQVAHELIFLPEGNRVFWSDPEMSYATSAVCWNAGVSCTGGPGTYDDCLAANKNIQGNSTNDGSEAAMQPLSRYIELLQEIHTEKRARSNASVLVAAMAGVPPGYADGVELIYQDTSDVGFQGDFGIGPGCESSTGQAVPPVRLRQLSEAFAEPNQRNLHSICADSFHDAVAAIAQLLLDHVE
jgi:hypothetical protein